MQTEVIAKQYLDEVDQLIKLRLVVEGENRNISKSDDMNSQNEQQPEPVGKFGTSILYKWGEFNFHPRAYEILSKIHKLKFRDDDVILTMFPKSGSTWLSECIYLIVNQYHYEVASKESIEYRFPQIDSPSHDVFELILEQYNNPNQRRLIKSSVPPHLLVNRNNAQVSPLPTLNNKTTTTPAVKPKVISILRNPRDVLVSFYHHCKTVKHYDIDFTFDEFYETFVTGKMPCGPIWMMYNEMLKYHLANPRTSLVIFYEDMKQDLRKQIRRICEFLEKPEPAGEDDWSRLLEHLSVDRMRQNRTINRHDWDQLGLRNKNGFEFVRKGQVNDWKNFFNEQQSIRFDAEVTDKLLPELKARYGHQKY